MYLFERNECKSLDLHGWTAGEGGCVDSGMIDALVEISESESDDRA
jgi:hypothetical protein